MPREWLLHGQFFHATQTRGASEDQSFLLVCFGQPSCSHCPLFLTTTVCRFSGKGEADVAEEQREKMHMKMLPLVSTRYDLVLLTFI